MSYEPTVRQRILDLARKHGEIDGVFLREKGVVETAIQGCYRLNDMVHRGLMVRGRRGWLLKDEIELSE